MSKTIIPIKGMHCRSCEILIEDKLKELPEIKNVQVIYKKSEAIIYSKKEFDSLDITKINQAIRDAGYDVGIDDSESWISKNPSEYFDLFLALIVVISLYYFAKGLGLFNISYGSSNPTGLLVVLIIGLTAGISTCMALVGGLVLGISSRHAEKHPEASAFQKFRPHLLFNLGRISTYFVLGGMIGIAGRAFQLSGTFLGILMILVGFFMFVLGLQLTDMFPKLSSGGLTLPSSISKLLGIKKHQDKKYSHLNSFFVGGLTFFLPCGFTQAMQLYAMSTGSFLSGALIMGMFAIGTAPGLLGIGGLTSFLKGEAAKKFFKFAGVLVVTLAVFNISNGLNLTGWKPSFADKTGGTGNDPNVTIENGVQIVRMDQSAGGYKPNTFTVKKGIPVKWIINSKKADVCSSSIAATKIGVRKILQSGENIIEFTPKETGEIKFSCLMGMYTGKFIVVEGGAAPLSAATNGNDAEKPAAPAPLPTRPEQDSNSTAPPALKQAPESTPVPDVQIIKATFNEVSYDATTDISPNEFTVAAGKPVRFEIAANADGDGCMGSIALPGLTKQMDFFEKGKTVIFDFTPTKKGTYPITCAMGVPRGVIKVS